MYNTDKLGAELGALSDGFSGMSGVLMVTRNAAYPMLCATLKTIHSASQKRPKGGIWGVTCQ